MSRAALRDAEPSDVPAIEAAYLLSWRAGYADLLPPEVLEERARQRRSYDWLDAIESHSSEVLVAVANGAVVGVVQAAEARGGDRDLPEITMLYVVPSSWGGWVAKDLLAAGTRWIRGQGHRAARLRVVEEQARARRFYEREGWVPWTCPAPRGLCTGQRRPMVTGRSRWHAARDAGAS